MHRRQFTNSILGGAAWLSVAAMIRSPSRSAAQEPDVNGERLLRHLERIGSVGAGPDGGISRLAFSDADREARRLATEWMGDAGLEVTTDVAGNLIGRSARGETTGLPLVIGSHIDSVPNGGNFDGPVGALGAIEVAHTLNDGGLALRHPLEVIVFANEEGGKTGSRALAGEVTARELELPTASGKSIGEGIAFLGGEPRLLARAARGTGTVHAFLELHVEQGDVLDRAGVPIGVVEGIVGIERWNVIVEGFANHAGTTPMGARRDALVAAARWIDTVHRVVSDLPGRQVATIGRIQAEPGVPNVIPGRATLSLEIRDLEMAKIASTFERLRAEAEVIASATGTRFAFDRFYVSNAAPTSELLRTAIEESARSLGLTTMRLPSGAGHDAQSMAGLGPIGMIFVPSVAGISHSPAEYSRPEDIVRGANVLLRSVLRVDRS